MLKIKPIGNYNNAAKAEKRRLGLGHGKSTDGETDEKRIEVEGREDEDEVYDEEEEERLDQLAEAAAEAEEEQVVVCSFADLNTGDAASTGCGTGQGSGGGRAWSEENVINSPNGMSAGEKLKEKMKKKKIEAELREILIAKEVRNSSRNTLTHFTHTSHAHIILNIAICIEGQKLEKRQSGREKASNPLTVAGGQGSGNFS